MEEEYIIVLWWKLENGYCSDSKIKCYPWKKRPYCQFEKRVIASESQTVCQSVSPDLKKRQRRAPENVLYLLWTRHWQIKQKRKATFPLKLFCGGYMQHQMTTVTSPTVPRTHFTVFAGLTATTSLYALPGSLTQNPSPLFGTFWETALWRPARPFLLQSSRSVIYLPSVLRRKRLKRDDFFILFWEKQAGPEEPEIGGGMLHPHLSEARAASCQETRVNSGLYKELIELPLTPLFVD